VGKIVLELQSKAKLFKATGLVPVFDVSGIVLKSDTVVSEDLKQELRRAVASLEDVPDGEKDWHPRSDDKVLDLVHPSLCPLVFGRSRIVSDRLITLDNCLEACGAGEVIPEPDLGPLPKSASYWHNQRSTNIWSKRFQWLPCEVDITGESPKIVSYINNLHPEHHRDLYSVVEKFIKKSLPLWDFIYRWPHETEQRTRKRITCTSATKVCQAAEPGETECNCEPEDRPLDPDEPPRLPDHEWWHLDDDHPTKAKDLAWYHRMHPCPQPEPTPFSELPEITSASFRKEKGERLFDIGKQQSGGTRIAAQEPVSRIQVIVKLANIHLTPDKPTYSGGSWHVEGQLNEHICATALDYYDSANITPSHLAFRTSANEEQLSLELDHLQNDYRAIEGVLAIDAGGNTLQNLGRTTTPEGRLLAFPNVYQHRVAPFELADKTKPGHRKILALFLVDLHVPVISTANVAPQQEEWWFSGGGGGDVDSDPREGGSSRIARLPRELQDMVRKEMDWVFSREEAKELRLELMEERTRMDEAVDGVVREAEWNFCEH
jgi:hypothetical protein